MMIFRTTLHAHRVEYRLGDFYGESVVLNGKEISSVPINWNGRGHFFQITDEQGKTRHIELRRRSRKLGYEVIVSVDGEIRSVLKPEAESAILTGCRNCGYDLAGLPEEHGERRCPECGRHTPV